MNKIINIDGMQNNNKINNNIIIKNKYKFFPKNKDELKTIIKNQITKYGNECDLNNIDTSKIKDMNSLFLKSNFNGNISNWNVSNVKNMSLMFMDSKFNKNISKWNVSNVENMSGMFYTSKFNQDISNWNVCNVENMTSMFSDSKFNRDISKWNISTASDISWMFNELNYNKDISNWFLKLNKNCVMNNFGEFNNIKINSYNDFKKYHREMILKKL